MLLRALLVMLVVLNAGAAAWWLFRAPAPMREAPAHPRGVALLELADAPTPVAGASAPSAAPVALPAKCLRYGPFPDQQAFVAARDAVAREVLWTATAREIVAPRGWRVILPQATREEATATAARIGAAGFSDYLVLPASGDDANAIALGRYGAQGAARERVQALAAAGFAAVAEPVGGREVLWLDVAAAAGFAPQSATLGMAGTPVPCTEVVRDGRYTIDRPA